MNLAHWLERSAAVFGERPAIARGRVAVCSYREFAASAARAAAWLHEQGLVPGDRVGFFLANQPDYLRLLWGAWWAGMVAVPINARLHGREAAFILSDCAATMCFADASHADKLADHVPGACRIIEEHPFLDAASDPRRARRRSRRRRSRRAEDDDAALLHQRQPASPGVHERPQRALDDDLPGPRQPVPGDAMLHPAPLSHGNGMYHFRTCSTAASMCCESGGSTAPRSRRWPRTGATRRCSPRPRWSPAGRLGARAGSAAGAGHRRLRRRADVPRRHRGRVRRAWPASRADLRPGRKPDDDHRAAEARDRGSRASAPSRAAGLGRLPAADGRAVDSRARRHPVADRRGGRGLRARRGRHEGLLEPAARDRRGAARRLAAHRRHRPPRRRRLPDAARSREGPDHQRRQQHLSARGRGALLPPPGRGRGQRDRRADAEWARSSSPTVAHAPVGENEPTAAAEHIARFKRPRRYPSSSVPRTTTARC